MRLTLRGVGPAEGPHPHGSPSAATEGEWLRKAKEDKKRKKQWKLKAWERGEDTDNDDDDYNGDDDEVMEEEEIVANDVEWDNLENEDALTGLGSSL